MATADDFGVTISTLLLILQVCLLVLMIYGCIFSLQSNLYPL